MACALLLDNSRNHRAQKMKGEAMAANFSMKVKRHRSSVDIFLKGDIDGSSALELLEKVKKTGVPGRRLTIHTKGVRRLAPFGKEILEKRFNEVEGLVTGFDHGRRTPGGSSSSVRQLKLI